MNKPNAPQPAKTRKQVQWEKIMEMFEKLCSLPKAEATAFLKKDGLSKQVKDKLIQMLSAVDRTASLVDTPLADRITAQFDDFSESLVGTKLNGYQLLELLSMGSLTSVYKASQQEPVPRTVAIKIIRPDAPIDSIALFRLESKALAKLSHPNIATIYTVETDPKGVPFIVMEYISGLALIQYCDEFLLTIEQRLSLFLLVCDAITHSHKRGILHRDIKSSNILVVESEGATPVPTVIDFGISSHLDQDVDDVAKQSMGTPEYMSPEHLNDGGEVDVRSDVYSLGMVLFSLLVGRVPFDRRQFSQHDYDQRRQMIVDFQPPVPSEYYSSLSQEEQSNIVRNHAMCVRKYRRLLTAELDWIYTLATSKDPEQRYQSVAELAEDINRCMKNEVLQAKPASCFYRFKKFIQRHFVMAAALAIACIVGVLFIAAVLEQNRQIKIEFERAEKERDVTQQVFDVIATFLNTVDPWTMGKDLDITVEDMIERGVAQLRSNNDLSPEVKYKLFLKLSKTYRSIGLPAKAQVINNLILDRQDYPDAITDIEANINASLLLRLLKNNKGQLEFAQRAYDLCVQNNISGLLLIRALRRLGNAHYALGLFLQAKASVDQSYYLYASQNIDDPLLKADIILDLANVTYWLNDYEGAERLYKQALRINQVSFGDEHPRVVTNKVHLAELWRIVGKYNDAIPVIENSYAIQRKYLGDKHIDVLNTQGELVRAYRYAKEFDKAELAVVDLIPKLNDVFGESEDESIMFAVELGQIYEGQGRFDEAVAVLMRAHDLSQANRSQLGDYQEPVVGYVDTVLAHALMFNNRPRDALIYVNNAIQFYRAPSTYNDFYIADSLIVRAGIHIELNDFVAAENDALETINIFAPMLGKNHDRVTKANIALSYARLRQKWTEEDYASLLSGYMWLKEQNPKDEVEIKRVGAWLNCWQKVPLDHVCSQ